MTRRDGTPTIGTWPGTVLATTLGTALLAIGLAPATLDAQQNAGRWLAWTGCWQPASERPLDDGPVMARPAADAEDAAEAETGEGDAATLVCFQPIEGEAAIEKITVAGTEIVSRETLRADGERRETSAEGCTGWESADFASRPGRVYTTSEHTCEGGVSRTSSGMLALVSTGEWVDIQVVSAEGESGTWITRYQLASPPDTEAAGFGALGAEQVMAVRAARVAASARPTVDDVIEASAAVDGEAVEAWLLERDARLDLDADALVRLADAGVPDEVIDMAVAVSYPERFAVEAETDRYGERYAGYGYGRPWGGYYSPFYGSAFWSPFGFYRPFGFYSRYYGFGFGSPFFGSGRHFGGIRVVPIRGGGDSGGRVISGQGYRRGSGASPRSGGATPRSGAIRSPTGRSAQPRSSGSRSSGSSSGRKAKPRGGGGNGGGNGGM